MVAVAAVVVVVGAVVMTGFGVVTVDVISVVSSTELGPPPAGSCVWMVEAVPDVAGDGDDVLRGQGLNNEVGSTMVVLWGSMVIVVVCEMIESQGIGGGRSPKVDESDDSTEVMVDAVVVKGGGTVIEEDEEDGEDEEEEESIGDGIIEDVGNGGGGDGVADNGVG